MKKFLIMLYDFFYWRSIKNQMEHQIRYTEDMLVDKNGEGIDPARQAQIVMHIDFILKQREKEKTWKRALNKY